MLAHCGAAGQGKDAYKIVKTGKDGFVCIKYREATQPQKNCSWGLRKSSSHKDKPKKTETSNVYRPPRPDQFNKLGLLASSLRLPKMTGSDIPTKAGTHEIIDATKQEHIFWLIRGSTRLSNLLGSFALDIFFPLEFMCFQESIAF